MSTTLDTLQAAVLRLPQSERARLLDRLIVSLDVDVEAEAAWDSLAQQREQDLDAGLVQAKPLRDVIARLEALFPG